LIFLVTWVLPCNAPSCGSSHFLRSQLTSDGDKKKRMAGAIRIRRPQGGPWGRSKKYSACFTEILFHSHAPRGNSQGTLQRPQKRPQGRSKKAPTQSVGTTRMKNVGGFGKKKSRGKVVTLHKIHACQGRKNCG